MSMTREEAIKWIADLCDRYSKQAEEYEKQGALIPMDAMYPYIQALGVALTALRPVSREQVERMRGEWVAKHRHRGGFRRATGVDDMGEQRTITIDERCEYDDRYCSKCGKQSPDNFLNFCGYCGAPMTDEAVEMVMERMEALHENRD